MKELQKIYKYTKDLLNDEPEKSAYWHYNKLVSKIEETIDVIHCCKGEAEQLFCDCEMPKPIDPHDVVDRHICRDCKQIIAK